MEFRVCENGAMKTVVQEISGKIDSVLIVGNPNVGKSVIFHRLTGQYVTVSNYPGTSVEMARGRAKLSNRQYVVVDTPGVYSLFPLSEDERVTRDILLELEGPVIQVIDSKNLARALQVTFQLVTMGKRVVLDLNMDDEARASGITIDSDSLEEITGLKCVKTDAIRRNGIDRLKKSVSDDSDPKRLVKYGKEIENALAAIERILPEDLPVSRKFVAISLLSGDNTIRGWLQSRNQAMEFFGIDEIIQQTQSCYAEPLRQIIIRVQGQTARKIVSQVQVRDDFPSIIKMGSRPLEFASHPVIAILIASFLAFLTALTLRKWHYSLVPIWFLFGWLVYTFRYRIVNSLEKGSFSRGYSWILLLAILSFTYLFVGEFGAGICVDFLETHLFGSWLNPLIERIVNGITTNLLIREILVDPIHGMFPVAVTYAIAIVFPIVTAFFILFGIMEDSGYLPRLAMMVNRFFRYVGLNGKAVLPMVLGLGCDTMATMTARILPTKKERIIVTLLLALGIPCSAQLGVIMGMAASLSFTMATVIILSVLFSMLLVGYLSSRILPGVSSDFIQEIPPIRIPEIKNILIKTAARVRWYLREALPLFILGTFILFLLTKLGIMSRIEKFSAPVVVHLLGLPIEATRAFLIGFLRRDYAATELFIISRNSGLDPVQVVVGLVTITLFVPCIAHFFIIIKERGLRMAICISAFVFGFALICGGVLNQFLHIPFIRTIIE